MHPALLAAVADEQRRDLFRAAQLTRTATARTRSTFGLRTSLRRKLPPLTLRPAASPQPCC